MEAITDFASSIQRGEMLERFSADGESRGCPAPERPQEAAGLRRFKAVKGLQKGMGLERS